MRGPNQHPNSFSKTYFSVKKKEKKSFFCSSSWNNQCPSHDPFDNVNVTQSYKNIQTYFPFKIYRIEEKMQLS